MKFGYERGYEAGYATCKEQYERQVALLTEQLADARASERAAITRADNTFDQFMLKVGAQPVSAPAQQLRHDLVKEAINRHGIVEPDAFEEFPLGDERGQYKTADDASLALDS